MDQSTIADLESLLRLPTGNGTSVVADAAMLTCGCLVSESQFASTLTSNSTIEGAGTRCFVCGRSDVRVLNQIKPLRELYDIVVSLQQQKTSRRRSSSKRSSLDASIRRGSMGAGKKSSFSAGTSPSAEATDLLGLFYKFAKEETTTPPDFRKVNFEPTPPVAATTSDPMASFEPNPVKQGAAPAPLESHSMRQTSLEHSSRQGTAPVSQPIDIKQPASASSRSRLSSSLSSSSFTRGTAFPKSGSISPLTNSIVAQPMSSESSSFTNLLSQSPNKDITNSSELIDASRGSVVKSDTTSTTSNNYDNLHNLLDDLNETKEYNFSKCFPFHRKVTTFPTQTMRFSFPSNPFKFSSGGTNSNGNGAGGSSGGGSMIRKPSRFIDSDIHTYTDPISGKEVTRFVLMADKRWEVYEYVSDHHGYNEHTSKPVLICCGKSNGDHGPNFNSLISASTKDDSGEVIVRNEFNVANSNNASSGKSDDDLRKKLSSWEQLYCQISARFLIISGTKGIMRVLNMDATSGGLGRPVYTYVTNFPIRCISASPNEQLIACGITARERLSGKEQPFIILHTLLNDGVEGSGHGSHKWAINSKPITITIPYRDPIKIIRFNASSTHLVCCTAWESRYLIIKLRDANSNNYKRPRLIWTDVKYLRNQIDDSKSGNSRGKKTPDANNDQGSGRRNKRGEYSMDDINANGNEGGGNDGMYHYDYDHELMMENEGITDLQFGSSHSNTVVLTSSSLNNRPSVVIRLDGPQIDSKQPGVLKKWHQNRSNSNTNASDDFGTSMSVHSSQHSNYNEIDATSVNSFDSPGNASASNDYKDTSEASNIKDAEIVMRFPEIGSMIYGFSMSPRGDGIVFLDKAGRLFLVSTPNFRLNASSASSSQPPQELAMKKIVVLLGQVAGAERYSEAASVRFSSDGGKVFVVDRKGVLSVFDFTKGVPGQDADVVKCKIVTM